MNNDAKLNFLRQNGVDVDTGISNMMDVDTYNDIMNDFYNSMPEELSKIDNFKVQGDMPNYAILVHAMKSNARSFGFNTLGELSYNHEMASKANDINYVNDHYQELVNEANKVRDLITKYKSM